jgi:hypothetical protein
MAASSSAVHKRHLEVHFGDFGTKLYTKLLGKPFPIPEKEAPPPGLLRPPRAPKRRLRDSPRRSILPRSPTPARRSTPARIPVLKEVSNTQAETAVGTQTGTQADIQAGAQEDDNTDDNDQDFDPYGPHEEFLVDQDGKSFMLATYNDDAEPAQSSWINTGDETEKHDDEAVYYLARLAQVNKE